MKHTFSFAPDGGPDHCCSHDEETNSNEGGKADVENRYSFLIMIQDCRKYKHNVRNKDIWAEYIEQCMILNIFIRNNLANCEVLIWHYVQNIATYSKMEMNYQGCDGGRFVPPQ